MVGEFFNSKHGNDPTTHRVLVVTILMMLGLCVSGSSAQDKGGRDSSSKTPRKTRPVISPNRPAPKPKRASIVITIDPPDSALLIDDQPSDKVDQLGTLRLTDMKPGTHTVLVKKSGYREKQQSIDFKAGINEPLTIKLDMLKGSLTVLPNVDGAEINLRKIDVDQNVGTYVGSIKQIEFPPGEYELNISKKGFKPTTRRFTLRGGESAYLEPHLEALPKPRPQIAMTTSVRTDGKYFVVQLFGSSGADLPKSGAIDVSYVKSSALPDVNGTFTGLPCNIDIVWVENVADASLIEYPGTTNQWAKAVVRVRPKDAKKPVRFAINWRVREQAVGELNLGGTDNTLSVTVQRPDYPSSRFITHTAVGVVTLTVPENWREVRGQQSIWFAPNNAHVSKNGQSIFTHGVSVGTTQTRSRHLQLATNEFLSQLQQGNLKLQSRGQYQTTSVGRHNALWIRLSNTNEATGLPELVTLITAQLGSGQLCYIIMVAEETDFPAYQNTFQTILRSVQFKD